ncbi:hypothetical protein VaNZ11_003363 [Volvox africanus]|uniref:Cyclic nucleotide-binding domain-containing protein n=1 Tax=Volvox africanus TaxID=51714 RepID=A0ABQ5RU16_9CHLO|nr:hypothetical protein VaNZ11_003363 [Volvox africanus]
MPMPGAQPAMGTQLTDGGPDPAIYRKAGAAAPHFHDSDQNVRGLAVTADSTSYDTETDPHVTNGTTNPLCNSSSRPFETPPVLMNPRSPGDGEIDEPTPSDLPQLLPSCSDWAWYYGGLLLRAVRRLHDAAFKPPADFTDGKNVGALRSLVTRQVHVEIEEWESYKKELADRVNTPREASRLPLVDWPLWHPLCGAAIWWSTAMLLFDLIFTAFWVPVNVAFCLDHYGRLDAVCTRTDLAGGFVYLLNVLLGFQMGVTLTCGYRSRSVIDRRDATRLYAFTLSFWLDVLAVAPFVYLVAVVALGDAVARHQTVSIISLVRLVRLFRVASIIKKLYSSSTSGEVQSSWVADNFSVTPLYMALLVYLAMVLVNMYACLLLLIARYEQEHGRPSWMSSVTWEDVSGLVAAKRWYNAVYFCITVMTTTGYADFLPKSPIELGLVSFMMLNGLVIVGTVVALIGSAMNRSQEQAQRSHDQRKRLTSLREWLKGRVPDRDCQDVITFYAELSARRDEGRSEGDIVFELPAYLKQQVGKHIVQNLLSQCAPLARLEPEVHELLASCCVPMELPRGHDLCGLGQDVESSGGGLWLLEKGAVTALRNQEPWEMPAKDTPDDLPCLLGEGALLTGIIPASRSRMWTIRTERPCRIWQLRESALKACLRIYPYIADHVMEFVRDRIMAWLTGQEDRENYGWCELVQLLKRSFIMGPLRERLTYCYLALHLANLADGSLPQLLEAWLEMSVMREMILKDEPTNQEAGVAIASTISSSNSRPTTANHENLVTPTAQPVSIASGRSLHGNTTVPSVQPSLASNEGPAAPLPLPFLTVSHSDADNVCGGGGGDASVQVDLPLPPSASSPVSGWFRSPSERPSPSFLPPAVEQGLLRVGSVQRTHGNDGGLTPTSEGLSRAKIDVAETASDLGIGSGIGGGALEQSAAAAAARPFQVGAPSVAAVSPRPLQFVSPFAIAAALTNRNMSAELNGHAAAAAENSMKLGTSPLASANSGLTPSLLQGTPPASPSLRGGVTRSVSVGGAASLNAVAGSLVQFPCWFSPGSPQWVPVPEFGRANLATNTSMPNPSPVISKTSQPALAMAAAAAAALQPVTSNGWRRATFDYHGDGGGQHVLVQPTSPVGPKSPTAASDTLWYGFAPNSAAAAAVAPIGDTAVRVQQTPTSPQGPGASSQRPPSPPPPWLVPPSSPEALLAYQSLSMHTSLVHSIFLAAGVNLQPRQSDMTPGETKAAPGRPLATGPLQPVGLTILAPACSICSCATCAYCAQLVGPPGAGPLVQQLELEARGMSAASSIACVSQHSPPPGAVLENVASAGCLERTKGHLEGSQDMPSRQGSGVIVHRQASGSNISGIGGVAGDGQASGIDSSTSNGGGGEVSAARLGFSASRQASFPMPAVVSRNPGSRLRRSSIPRSAVTHQRPPQAVAQEGLTRMRSTSSVGYSGAGVSAGGSTSAAGVGRARLGGDGGLNHSRSGGIRSPGGGSGSFGFGGGLLAIGTSNGGRVGGDSSSQLTPGAALAAAAASVSGPVEGADSGSGGSERPAEGLQPLEAGLADAVLPHSGTIRIV